MDCASLNVSHLQTELEKRALLRRSTVEEITGLSTSSLYDAIRSGHFPAPIRIFPGTANRSVAWRASQILEWLDERRSS
jgi:predicted DNA-binding transcriptional regulator AlpA